MRRELWNGNRETWRSLVIPDRRPNILLRSWSEHANYRRKYEIASASDPAALWIRLRTPRDAEHWLSNIKA